MTCRPAKRRVLRKGWLILGRHPTYLPILAASLTLTLILTRNSILLGLGQFLVVKDDPLRPADLIHVLGGYGRLDYAFSLYQQSYAPRLFVTGGGDAVYYKRDLIAQGARPTDLQPEQSWATSTYEEARELKQFLENHPAIRSVIIVSSPYHMRRAQWTFKHVLGNRVRLQFAPVPFEMSWHKREWWTDARSKTMVQQEYVKLLFYRIKYQFGLEDSTDDDNS